MRDVEGALLAGRYELQEQIGVGGAGAVFRAYDRVLDRDVAVKRMHPGAEDDARARLQVEARLSGMLAHPGIARVHDFGEDGASAPYLVMEYVDGVPLRDLLRDRGPLEPDRVMGIIAQLADALQVAHNVGIVHRDVKPSNILVRPDGTVTLIDFGIARAHDVEPLTLTGTIVGTVDYISPEQAGGAGATPLSDLYALGLVAYECLTGVRPLRRDTQVATLMAHVTEDVPVLPRTFPEPVRDLVRRLTARDPRRRPADAATVGRLARAAIGAPLVAAPPRRPGRRMWPAWRPRLGPAVAAPVAAALVLALCVLAWQEGSGRPQAAAQADAVAAQPSTPSPSTVPAAAITRSAAPVAASSPVAPRHVRVKAPHHGTKHHPHRHAAKPKKHAKPHAKGGPAHHRPKPHGAGRRGRH